MLSMLPEPPKHTPIILPEVPKHTPIILRNKYDEDTIFKMKKVYKQLQDLKKQKENLQKQKEEQDKLLLLISKMTQREIEALLNYK